MSEADILQSDAANVSASPMARSTPSIASVTSALQKLNINNTEYEVLKAMPNKRGTTSWVWDHGVKLKDLSPSLSKARVKYRWMCRRCFEKGEHVTYAASTTSHAMNHLIDLIKMGLSPLIQIFNQLAKMLNGLASISVTSKIF